jgi:uncharacterized metal-binding protein
MTQRNTTTTVTVTEACAQADYAIRRCTELEAELSDVRRMVAIAIAQSSTLAPIDGCPMHCGKTEACFRFENRHWGRCRTHGCT